MTETKGRKLFSSLFMFTKKDLVLQITSYCPKKGKLVLLLSSYAPDTDEVEPTKNAKECEKKPQVILDYNATKAGVDIFDMLSKNYPVKRISRRWPVAVFFNFLETALINAWILLKEKKQYNDRRKQLISLVSSLTDPFIELKQQESASTTQPPKKKPRGLKCQVCPAPCVSKQTASHYCSSCHIPVCNSHSKVSVLCLNCQE